MRLEIIENIIKIEEQIEKLESIVSCKIIQGEDSSFHEVHIVSNKNRSAKQLVRDVQSLLIATYGIQIDHKIISIAEIMCDDVKKKYKRLKVLSVSYDNNGDKVSIKISLEKDGEIFSNASQGINVRRNIDRMLVDTTLRTIEEAFGYEETFVLEDIKTVSFNTAEAVVVIIGIYNTIEQRFCGTSLVGQDDKKAVVKATLDAVNRYLIK